MEPAFDARRRGSGDLGFIVRSIAFLARDTLRSRVVDVWHQSF